MDGPVLTLDAALDGCGVGLVQCGVVLASRVQAGGRGSAAILPTMTAAILEEAGVDLRGVMRIAVTVGPGSFTGVRAALALGQGIGLAAGVAVVGVTVGAALRAEAGDVGRAIWVAVDSRRGRVFLDREGVVATVALEALPVPDRPVAVAGDAGIAVASRLLARGGDVLLLAGRVPGPLGIAAAAMLRPYPAVPLYVDPPEARANPGLRPAPTG